ncbi:zf-HC2 domain-containing protein [Streptomyces phaeochromogenes]|uniref:anti-sigma factor family protein n=1 Tax=Streptomyces phaeochromogenes TaxID=1923 RepID=UPI0033C7B51E|nr:zf-HC2 domain-containing protein [Streptomyces phaeochromogenes]
MTRQHPQSELLGAYVLGILDAKEQSKLGEHTSECEGCQLELAGLQEMEAALGKVPPEAFIEGPPEDGSLLLQRTLRQVREEQSSTWRRRSLSVGLGAAASAAVLVVVGYLVGGAGGSSSSEVAGQPVVSAEPTAGVRVASATDAGTGVRMAIRLTPAVGWVRVKAQVAGIPAGERCQLMVVSADGERQIAGTWVVAPASSSEAEDKGTSLNGSAAVDPGQVKSVLVVNEEGKQYVSVPL